MQKTFKRVLAVVLALVLALSVFTISVSAAVENYNPDYESTTHTVFKHTEQTLAPGVEFYNNYAYATSDGNQMVYYVTTADVSRDDVVVQTSYKDQYVNGEFGMSKLSEQVAFANSLYTDPTSDRFISENYNVVSGVNASFYNMQTGQPSGVVYLDGIPIGESASYNTYFAIVDNGDGTKSAVIDYTKATSKVTPKTPFASIQDNVLQACAGNTMLVYDGEACTSSETAYMTTRASRTCIGITADGKVVTMVLDGRQEPFSCGGTSDELAQIMLEAGCVYAINLDGGGSTTFGTRPEGEDSFRVINRPSDGSERSISTGIIIASLAAPSNVFERVAMSAEDEYVTPGTSTNITVTGVSASGSSADIPAEVTYEAENGTFSDGVFTAGNAAGDAVVKAVYNGEVVGSTTIHVAVPDSIAFTAENFTIPYGKSAELGIEAKTGLNVIKTKPSDFTFTVTDAASGTLDGFTFTAAEESDIASTTITAAYNGTELTASAGLVFGKGSEVIFDFEDGTTNGFGLSYSGYNYYLPNSKVFVANKDNGQVHSGNYALGLNIDYSNSQESGYQMTALYQGKTSGNINYYPGAIKLGTWLYIPDEYVGLWVRWTVAPITAVNDDGTYTLGSITSNAMDNGAGGTGVVYSFDEPGWHYLTADLSQYKGLAWRDFYYCMQFYISDRDGASYGYYAKDNHNINGDFTVYMDDVTLDYSTVVEDREAPVFSSVILGDEGPHSNEGMTLSNGYVSDGYSKLDLSARVAEDTSKSNYSGLNASTAKVYIDGNEVASNFANGIISAANAYDFAEGQHSVKFVIYDNAGNRASATRFFSVTNVDKAESVKVVAHDPSLDRILHGSLYWVDVVAENAEKIDTVTTTLNLDSMSKWELDHMTVADGFEASYEVVDAGDKIVKLTIKNNGSNLAGEQALVSMPIRAWEMDNSNKKGATSNKEWTYAEFKASKEFWPVATEVRIQQGEVNYTDGAKDSFTGENVFVWSESWANYANMTKTQEGKDYYNAWNGGHIHDAELIVTKEAKAPTCTEDGWTAEYSCATCNSVVTWSETVPATGHTYEVIDGVLKCTNCGELFNGTYTDGKLYADGIPVNGDVDGILYEDGVPYNGYKEIDGVYRNFEDGVDKGTYNGLVEKDGDIYYAKFGVFSSGWRIDENDNYYYFSPVDNKAVDGVVTIDGKTYTFVDKKLYDGHWEITDKGVRLYWAGEMIKTKWFQIRDDRYFFYPTGYAATGLQVVNVTSNGEKGAFVFGDDGKLIERLTGNGLVFYGNDAAFLENDVAVHAGLVRSEAGDFYYIDNTLKAVRNVTRNISEGRTNGLLPSGEYTFGDDGKMVNDIKQGIVEEDGELYYYVDGQKTAAYLVNVDGKYYFFGSSLFATRNTTRFISEEKSNGLLPEGYYTFGDDGAIVFAKEGIVEEDGELYYYVDGEKTAAGVVKVNGKYYFFGSSLYASRDMTRFISASKTNGLIEEGYYTIDSNGVIIVPENDGIVEVDGELYYFENGEKTVKNLVEVDGKYYFFGSSLYATRSRTRFISEAKTNGLLPEGYYTFGDDGAIII